MIVDSLRPDHVGAYGSPRVHTPNVDALAARSLKFTRAFPEALVTVPARRSIYTGRRIFPYRNHEPVYDLGISPGWDKIDDLDQTLVKALRDGGYYTAQVADNPVIGFTETYRPFRRSWDDYVSIDGYVGQRRDPDTVSDQLVRQWLPKELASNPRYADGMKRYLANTGYGRDESETNAARVFEEARRTLRKAVAQPKPFAMTVDCFVPHEPFSPPPKYLELYGDPDYEGPNIGSVDYGFASYMSDPEIRRLRATYAASVTLMDHHLGLFMKTFREYDLERNTVVVLMSDHGFLLGDRGWVGKIPEELHPEMAQIVMMISHPDGRRHGESSSFMASTHDVARTVTSMLGLRRPSWAEGEDLSRLLDSERAISRDFHYGGMFNRHFVRTDEWLVLSDNAYEKPELYDLTLDPGENRDVHRGNERRARELYREMVARIGGKPPPTYAVSELDRKIDAERKRRNFNPD